MSMRICLWGKAFGIDRIIDSCRRAGVEILAIFDNDPGKWGTWCEGLETVSPARLTEFSPDYVLVVSHSFDAITEQAIGLGYERERMLAYHRHTQEVMARLGASPRLYFNRYALGDGGELNTVTSGLEIRGKTEGDIASPVPLEAQVAIAKRLMDAYILAQECASNVCQLYQVGKNWGGVLKSTRGDLYDITRRGDAHALAEALGNFCRNGLSESIMGGERAYRSFLDSRHDTWMQHNLEVWMALLDGKASVEETSMPPIGNPYGYDVEGSIINWNSFPNHARAYRCATLLEGVDRPVVAEIGGGFGGFAYNLLKRSPGVTYVDFDLPENLIIASYYLSMAFPDRRILLYDSPELVLDEELLRNYDAVMMPNFMLPKLADRAADLLINTISFSEMEYTTIEEYFRQVDRVSGRYFYHENLSCHPPYKGYPTAVFPRLRNFKEIMVSFSPWQGLDAYTKGHSYMERLYMRRGVECAGCAGVTG